MCAKLMDLKHFCMMSLIVVMITLLTASASAEPTDKEDFIIENPEHYIAVDNVCAWPNLTLLPDGTIVAAIFNQPFHSGAEADGDIDCYGSTDGGKTWNFIGTATENKTGLNRKNHAAGLTNDGSLVVISSGRILKEKPGTKAFYSTPVVCRSGDGGKTWERSYSVEIPPEVMGFEPFGDIVQISDSVLAVSMYGFGITVKTLKNQCRAYILYSYDDGRSWKNPTIIGEQNHKLNEGVLYSNYNEAAILKHPSGRLLAAPRRTTGGNSSDIELLVSEDDGKTWNVPENMLGWGLTGYLENPGHLLLLDDGRILLTYGIRWGERGVGARISDDGGKTWGAPIIVLQYGYEMKDWGGYPSSVQLDDGTIVSAYYDEENYFHHRYHMGVVRWKIPKNYK